MDLPWVDMDASKIKRMETQTSSRTNFSEMELMSISKGGVVPRANWTLLLAIREGVF